MSRWTILLAGSLLLSSCDVAEDAPNAVDPSPVDNVVVHSALDNEVAKIAADGEAATNAAIVAQKMPGAECLSFWDASAPQLVDLVKARLRDPESFEHIDTRLYPPSHGLSTLVMKFRSRNGFGGMEEGVATGTLNPNNCDVTLTKLR